MVEVGCLELLSPNCRLSLQFFFCWALCCCIVFLGGWFVVSLFFLLVFGCDLYTQCVYVTFFQCFLIYSLSLKIQKKKKKEKIWGTT